MEKIAKHQKNLLLIGLAFIGLFFLNLAVLAQTTASSTLIESLKNLESKNLSRPAAIDRAKDWDLLQFKLKKVRYLLRNYKQSPDVLALAGKELKTAEDLSASLQQNAAFPVQTGVAEEAYLDDIDGSIQPFIRYLPKNYDKNKKYPLIIYLHGYSPYLNIVNWSVLPEGLEELAENQDACVVMPFARSNTDFQGIGEQDVLKVIEQIKARYHIDEDRIFLTGMSMGGMGVWTIGSHFPHLFAGLVVLSGRGDFYFWHKLNPETMPEYQRLLIDKEFAAAHLPNLKKIPVWVFHGNDDTLIPLEEARHMKALLEPINPSFKYKEIADGDHWIHEEAFGDKDLGEWMRKASRKSPESFEFISYHPSYNRAYWLYISEYTDNTKPGEIRVKVADKKILIHTSGIKGLILDRNKMPERIRKFPVSRENDFKITEVPDYQNAIKVADYGPVKDVFLAPFMFVDAGAKAEDGSPAIQQRAYEWYKFSKSLPRVKTEKELTDNDKQSFNLVLFGEPESSPMIQEVLNRTPVKITKDEFIIGEKKFPRPGNGLYLKYPSPWNPAKSVVIQCGIPWGEKCSPNHLYDSLPGYIVYSSAPDTGDPFGGNKALAAGFFDVQGKISR